MNFIACHIITCSNTNKRQIFPSLIFKALSLWLWSVNCSADRDLSDKSYQNTEQDVTDRCLSFLPSETKA